MSKNLENVVILHQFPRAIFAPSLSPFALKLETWLRMAGIKYQNEFSLTGRSAKGQVPFITLNGVDVADSQFCIDYLSAKFDKNLSSHLNAAEKPLARSFFKMCEESLRWVLVVDRFKYGKGDDIGLNFLVFKLAARGAVKNGEAQGYGRHSQEELYQIGKGDLEALNSFIGNKQFLMGDKVINEDASIFGLLCQFLHHNRGTLHKYLMYECPNLMRYIENMKKLYWPDWNENLRK